jgi:hypothetical protein
MKLQSDFYTKSYNYSDEIVDRTRRQVRGDLREIAM